ncbi:uncharacterized protein [Rutidosis leptorrhynchoides]|uniref:uncharacterized protein isoform X1 n=1 Tax=Rutidosis leptorrhynchoides TaxID=125765 RepID=UPI003A98F754
MEEEMISLSNIMPVELAIKRELEYRKKMESLNNHGQNEFQPLVLGQAPVTESQTVVDRKRKVQPCNAQDSRMVQSSTRFVCVVCRVAFATAFHLRMHGETSAHKTKVDQSRNAGEGIGNPFYCELCDIMCSSGRVMEYHVAGFKHVTNLREFEEAKRARIQLNLALNR